MINIAPVKRSVVVEDILAIVATATAIVVVVISIAVAVVVGIACDAAQRIDDTGDRDREEADQIARARRRAAGRARRGQGICRADSSAGSRTAAAAAADAIGALEPPAVHERLGDHNRLVARHTLALDEPVDELAARYAVAHLLELVHAARLKDQPVRRVIDLYPQVAQLARVVDDQLLEGELGCSRCGRRLLRCAAANAAVTVQRLCAVVQQVLLTVALGHVERIICRLVVVAAAVAAVVVVVVVVARW